MLENGILHRHGLKCFITVQLLHFFLMVKPISRLLLEEPLVGIIHMNEFAEIASAALQLYIASLLNLAV